VSAKPNPAVQWSKGKMMKKKIHRTQDTGHRTQDTGHRTQDTGHRSAQRDIRAAMLSNTRSSTTATPAPPVAAAGVGLRASNVGVCSGVVGIAGSDWVSVFARKKEGQRSGWAMVHLSLATAARRGVIQHHALHGRGDPTPCSNRETRRFQNSTVTCSKKSA
jgi:hypothetical protein